jgi:hypothetical protein
VVRVHLSVPSVYDDPPSDEGEAASGSKSGSDAPSGKWRNRIVSHGDIRVDQAIANPLNWRVHPKLQKEALLDLIQEVGLVDTVMVNVQTGNLVDGHLRVQLADIEDQVTLPATYVDLDPEEEAKILAGFDTITLLALTDRQKLGEAIAQIASTGPALGQVLAEQLANGQDLSGSYELTSLGEFEGDDEDLEKERSTGELLEKLKEVSIAEPTTQCHTGDIYRLGNHVLVVVDPIRSWSSFIGYLTDVECLLVIYPGPFAALSDAAAAHKMVLVQPDLYLAGHLVDRFMDVHGPKAVVKL